MAAHKVPLVIYREDGERVIIGEASATIQNDEWVIVAEIDPTYGEAIFPSESHHYSIGTSKEE